MRKYVLLVVYLILTSCEAEQEKDFTVGHQIHQLSVGVAEIQPI